MQICLSAYIRSINLEQTVQKRQVTKQSKVLKLILFQFNRSAENYNAQSQPKAVE